MFVLVFEVTVVFVSPQFESAGGQEGGKGAIDGGKSILMEQWVTAGVGTDAVSK